MAKIRLLITTLLLVFVCASNTAFAAAEPILPYVMEQAALYRLDPENSSEKEEARQQAVLDEACRMITHYGTHEKLNDLVSVFLQNHWAPYDPAYKIIDATETGIGGNSSDVVFFVKDQQDTLRVVVKAFRKPRELKSKFLKEISALALLHQLSFTSASTVQPLAVGCGACQDCEYGLLLEATASGQRIDMIIKKLKEDNSPQKREESLAIVKKAFAQFGRGLAELHATRTSAPTTTSEKILAKMEKDYTTSLSDNGIRQTLIARGINLEQLETYFQALIEEVRAFPIYPSYQHGSPHLGNLLYDESSDHLTFIDVAKMYPTVGIDLRPLGDPTLDLMRTEDSLRKTSFGILSGEEVEEILMTFYYSYQENASLPYDRPMLHFHMVHKVIRRMNSNSHYATITDPQKQAQKRQSFEQSIDALQALISDQSQTASP